MSFKKKCRPRQRCGCSNCWAADVEGKKPVTNRDGTRLHNCCHKNCHELFNTQYGLDDHLRKHTNNKYSCKLQGCKKTFSEKTSLNRHMVKRHNGIKKKSQIIKEEKEIHVNPLYLIPGIELKEFEVVSNESIVLVEHKQNQSMNHRHEEQQQEFGERQLVQEESNNNHKHQLNQHFNLWWPELLRICLLNQSEKIKMLSSGIRE